jgi:hypothetical protein
MKESLSVFLLLILLNVFSFNNLQAQDFQVYFSIGDLEKYLGEPVPANVRQIDSKLWLIELSNDYTVQQNILLLSEDDIVVAVQFIFTSQGYGWLSGFREHLFKNIDKHGKNKTSDNNLVNWEIKPNIELGNNKYLSFGLTNVYPAGDENNEIWGLSIFMLDMNL